jgi:nitroimidazol reductase NimA-like FMN-containing flavoprotein (pyridoxamine 5'-phosphate oxidase superfamily)
MNSTEPETSPPATRLDSHDCWALLRSVQVGRLALVIDGQPEIFPVNYVVDHGTVVFRTADGSKVTAALTGEPLAFESDGFDPTDSKAWSVVVKGTASEIHDFDDLVAASLLPLEPWQGSPKHRFVRIEAAQITGRWFTVADGSIWHNPYTLRRAATFE